MLKIKSFQFQCKEVTRKEVPLVCFKSFVTYYKTIISQIIKVEARFKLFWKVYEKDNININMESLRLLKILVVPRELKEVHFSSKRPTTQIVRYQTLKSPLLKKLSVPLLPHFVGKSQTIKGTSCHFTQRMNECE